MTPVTYLACVMFLPETFTIGYGKVTILADGSEVPASREAPRIFAFWSVVLGVWGGLIIGFITEYYTSYEFGPT